MQFNMTSLSFAKHSVLLSAIILSTFSFAQTRPVNAVIDASKTSAPISKYIYGQFLEHIGGIVNDRHLGGDAGGPKVLSTRSLAPSCAAAGT